MEDVLRNIRLGIAPPVQGAIPSGTTGVKLPKNPIISYVLSQWRLLAWVSTQGKTKREGFKQVQQAVWEATQAQAETQPHCWPIPPPLTAEVSQAQPATSNQSHPPTYSKKPNIQTGPSQHPHQAATPPVINSQRTQSTNKQDGVLKRAPGWGAPIDKWRNFIHCQ
ncbi:hypothetical protein J3A83DRAFT_4190270 [Scleroderma citrinum]